MQADAKGVTFEVKAASDIPHALIGDPTRLTQVLVNLCGNAIKFTDSGGQVDLAVRMKRCSEDLLSLEFVVSDNGIGMTDEQLRGIFKPFVQADGSTTRKYGGTGLGLVISSRLVELMGGNINCSSVHGKGTTMSFCATLRRGLADGVPVELGCDNRLLADEAAKRVSGRRLLVVDDNEVNRIVIEDILAMSGMNVDVACDGVEALERITGGRYDCVLMDCQMPVMDGYEATREIRRIAGCQSLPIIALTANAMKGDKEKVIEVGMNDYLTKPIDPDELVLAIDRWVSGPAFGHPGRMQG